ncbi:hypothetical protein Ae201684P_015707 [Aphanomyces euteiches]|uniref:WRKY19-like zinc finger domain-containing protein n=1 Tax=Aphanomyces euteiches TaxID=100861 RepID=A0A6G0WIQ1_9STRA|nr:hypothetical protein Ae201684_014835 [Aphanomyces euteiches]KAH9072632.1 hypothetical protein Ae201684P_015707 [Aphanomyces euteiches]
MPATTTCIFPSCVNPQSKGSSKCSLHRRRSQCKVPSCPNQVYARQLCVRHGAKPECSLPDCQGNVRSGGLCSRHAPSLVKRCKEDGCTNVAHQRGKCVRHGGRRQCFVHGCQTHARKGGYCYRHGRAVCEPTHITVDKFESSRGDLAEIDDKAFESTLNRAITFELESFDVAPYEWELLRSILH